MRKAITGILILTALSAVPFSAYAEAFAEDWHQQWRLISGEDLAKRNADGSLEGQATESRNCWWVGGQEMHDYAVTARVKFLRAEGQYSSFNLMLRWSGETWSQRNGFWVYLRPKFRGLHMQKVMDGKLDPQFESRVQAERPKATPVGEWMNLRCELRGKEIRVYLDDQLHISVTDDDLFPILSGKLAFGFGDAHVIVSDITQTSLDDAARIDGATYSYLNKPTRGDEGATILTDGKVNPRERQAFWRMLSARPEILFDLGAEYFVTSIALRAYSSPAVNIDSADVVGSLDGDSWRTLASLRNEDGRRADAEHVISGPIRGVARYVKLLLNRPAADQDVELAEVEFFGRVPSDADREASAAKAYEIGPEMPPTTDAADSDSNYWYLCSPHARFAVSRTNGLIAGAWYLDRDTKCIERVADRYHLYSRSGDTETDEYADEVIEQNRTSASTLRIVCSNPALPNVRIAKSYAVSDDGRRLIKRVGFTNTSDAPDRFLTHATSAVLVEDYRRGGVYLGSDRGLGARLFAENVTVPRQVGTIGAPNSKVVLFQRYDMDWGLAQFRHKVNDHYSPPMTYTWHEKENHQPIYLPNGWRVGICTLHLAPGAEQSSETHLGFHEGREFHFYGMYRTLPEVAAGYDAVTRPEWVRDLKTDCAVALNPLSPDLEGPLMPVERTAQMVETGIISDLSHIHGTWGEWSTQGNVVDGYGMHIHTDTLREYMRRVREISPRIKQGIYTWAWTVHPHSEVCRNHPEWFITRDRNGQVFNAYSNMVLNHARRFGIPESLDECIAQYRRMIQDFDGDYFYLDGGGSGQNLIDWEHLGCDQDYHYAELYRRIREVTRELGDDRAVWFNARIGPSWDIGFFEGVDRVLTPNTWRESGDAMAACKMRLAYDPGQVIVPLYWRPDTLPYYSNYCIGLGLSPASPLGAVNQRIRLPFIEAAYENRQMRWIEADISPDWRTDPTVDIEAYALSHGTAAVISVIDHRADQSTPAVISADTEALELNPGRPIYAFVFGMRDIREAWPSLPESMRRAVYRDTRWALDLSARLLDIQVIDAPGERVSVSIPTTGPLLRMAFLSNSPAGVFSVNGFPTTFWGPANGGAHVSAELSPDRSRMSLTANAPEGGAEAIVLAPPGRVLTHPRGRALWFGSRNLLILPVAAGQSTTQITCAPAPRPETTPVVICSEQVAAGSALEFAVEPPMQSVDASIWRDDVLMWAGTIGLQGGSATVDVPEQTQAGTLTLRVSAGRERARPVTFTVTGDFTPKLLPVDLPKAGPQLTVTEVGRTIDGIEVLSAGTDTHDGYNGAQFALADAEALTIGGGNVDSPRTRYGYGFGGLELRGARVLTLRVTNTIHDAWSFLRNTISYKPEYTTTFAGMMVDYHTADGYTRRVALGMGVLNPRRTNNRPVWGAASAPDEFIALGDIVFDGGETLIAIDLARWAPENWDGQCWVSAGAENLAAARRLTVEILGNADNPDDIDITAGTPVGDLYAMRTYTVRRVPEAPVIDGRLDDAAWMQLKPAEDFVILGRVGQSRQATRAWAAWDDTNLYIAFECTESEKDQLSLAAEKIWNQDAIDIAIDVDADREYFHQIIVNGRGDTEQFNQGGEGRRETWDYACAVGGYDGGWAVEVAIPFAQMSVEPRRGMKWVGNFVRYRPYPPVDEMMTWSPLPGTSLIVPEKFGEWVFD